MPPETTHHHQPTGLSRIRTFLFPPLHLIQHALFRGEGEGCSEAWKLLKENLSMRGCVCVCADFSNEYVWAWQEARTVPEKLLAKVNLKVSASPPAPVHLSVCLVCPPERYE